jgi:hypothetical protein
VQQERLKAAESPDEQGVLGRAMAWLDGAIEYLRHNPFVAAAVALLAVAPIVVLFCLPGCDASIRQEYRFLNVYLRRYIGNVY